MQGRPLPTLRSLGIVDPQGNLAVKWIIPRLIAVDDDQAVPLFGELAIAVDQVPNPTAIKGLRIGDGETAGGISLNGLDSAHVVTVRAESADPMENGGLLHAAYENAKSLQGDRRTILVGPGSYQLISALEMDAEKIDLVGFGKDVTTIWTTDSDHDLIRQTANDVILANMTLIGGRSFAYYAWHPDDDLEQAQLHNVKLMSIDTISCMPQSIEYSGTYFNIESEHFSFGAGASGVASGKFYYCQCGGGSFGGDGGVASGLFHHCVGGYDSFGGGGGTIASTARLYYCIGENSFGTKDTGAKTLFCVLDNASYSSND